MQLEDVSVLITGGGSGLGAATARAVFDEMPRRDVVTWTSLLTGLARAGAHAAAVRAYHGMVAAGRYLQFRLRVPDTPGSLAALLAVLAGSDANVMEIEHVRTGSQLHVDEVEVALQLETKGHEHADAVLAGLRSAGYEPLFG